jgi:hypothetical protein
LLPPQLPLKGSNRLQKTKLKDTKIGKIAFFLHILYYSSR